MVSFLNAAYTFWRKRHYRLFEVPVDSVPSTPSAQRVRVDSSPISSSPLRFLSKVLGADEARSKAQADPQRDVWQLAVWDPLPICLRLFCYFSPGHVMIYWLSLPIAPTDPRPSVTVVTVIFVCLLFSLQLSALHSNFSQQSKDAAVISRETLHEYETKFVHPRTQPLYRDVGTQFSEHASYKTSRDDRYNFVEVHTPTVIINRGFKTNPNPNYSKYTDPAGVANTGPANQVRTSSLHTSSSTSAFTANPARQPSASQPLLRTPGRPPIVPLPSSSSTATTFSSPIRPSTAIRQAQQRTSTIDGQPLKSNSGGGGSLGVYSHADSPLKKTQQYQMTPQTRDSRYSLSPEKQQQQQRRYSNYSNFYDQKHQSHQLNQYQQHQQQPSPTRPQPSSPTKRMSVPGTGVNTAVATKRWGHLQPDGRRESGRI